MMVTYTGALMVTHITMMVIYIDTQMVTQTICITLGLGDTENVPCDNCNKKQCDYCGDIAVEHLLQ